MAKRIVDHQTRQEIAIRIADTAIEMADSAGSEGLTMRALASKVGMGTMTLYGFYSDKDALLDAMMDRVLGTAMFPVSKGIELQDYVVELGRTYLRIFREHPSVLEVITSRSTRTLAAMENSIEKPLRQLADYGLDGATVVDVFTWIMTTAIGAAGYQRPRPWSLGDPNSDSDELLRRQTLFFQALPLTTFSASVEFSAHLARSASEESFERHLKIVGEWARQQSPRGL